MYVRFRWMGDLGGAPSLWAYAEFETLRQQSDHSWS